MKKKTFIIMKRRKKQEFRRGRRLGKNFINQNRIYLKRKYYPFEYIPRQIMADRAFDLVRGGD